MNLSQDSHKGLRRFAFAKAINRQPRLADAGGQAGEVAVAAHQAKAIHAAGECNVSMASITSAESVTFLPLV